MNANICHKHNCIDSEITKIRRIMRMNKCLETESDLSVAFKTVKELEFHLQNIYAATEEARQMGKRMEERLFLYKETIEALGFKREKK